MFKDAPPTGADLDNPGFLNSWIEAHLGEPWYPSKDDPTLIWPKVNFMLDQQISVEDVILASNADFLAGTQLDQPGVPGVYTVWIASTVGDTTFSISLGGRTITDGAVAVLRANSEIRENEDPYYQMLSRSNGRPVIAITEVTAASIRVRVRFIPAVRT